MDDFVESAPLPSQERLSLLDPSLVELVRDSPEARCRSAAISMADDAVIGAGLENQLVESINALRRGAQVGTESIRQLQEQLDNTYWHEQELRDKGLSTDEDVSVRFRRARAAASLLAAMESNARYACCEATYEAYHASPDGRAVLTRLRDVLADPAPHRSPNRAP